MKRTLAAATAAGMGMLIYIIGERVGVEHGTEYTLQHIHKHFPEYLEQIKKGPNIVIPGKIIGYLGIFNKT